MTTETALFPTIQQLGDSYFIADQVHEADLERVENLGVRTLINLRPDNESAEQPLGVSIRAAAKARGLVYHHLPVASAKPSDETIQAFEAIYREAPQPILAFCSSGTRSAVMWAYALAPTHAVDDLLAQCDGCGYQLDKLRPRLLQRQGS